MNRDEPREAQPTESPVLEYRSPSAPEPQAIEPNPAARWSAWFGIAALACSVLAMVSASPLRPSRGEDMFVIPLVCALPAIVLGIVGLVRASRTKMRWPDAILGLTFGAVVMFFVVAAMTRSTAHPPGQRCQSNLRQIGLALRTYARDHGTRFPAGFDGILCKEYLAVPSCFVCPSTGDNPPSGPTTQATAASVLQSGRCSYRYVGAGLTLDCAQPAITVLAYEPLAHHKDFILVLCVDGHVEKIAKGRAARLITDLEAGVNPPRH